MSCGPHRSGWSRPTLGAVLTLALALLLGSHSTADAGLEAEWREDANACMASSPWAVENLRSCAAAIGRADAAVSAVTRASLHVARARAYARLGRHALALEDYSRALALNPTSPEAYLHQGIALRELGRFQPARAAFDHALRLAPELEHGLTPHAILVLRERGYLAMLEQDLRSALTDLESGATASDYDPVTGLYAAMTAFLMGQCAVAHAGFAAAARSFYPYEYLPVWIGLAEACSPEDAASEVPPMTVEQPSTTRLLGFMAGKADVDTVLGVTGTAPNEKRATLAARLHFYLGMVRCQRGEGAAALVNFTRSVELGTLTLLEAALARYQLNRPALGRCGR